MEFHKNSKKDNCINRIYIVLNLLQVNNNQLKKVDIVEFF